MNGGNHFVFFAVQLTFDLISCRTSLLQRQPIWVYMFMSLLTYFCMMDIVGAIFIFTQL